MLSSRRCWLSTSPWMPDVMPRSVPTRSLSAAMPRSFSASSASKSTWEWSCQGVGVQPRVSGRAQRAAARLGLVAGRTAGQSDGSKHGCGGAGAAVAAAQGPTHLRVGWRRPEQGPPIPAVGACRPPEGVRGWAKQEGTGHAGDTPWPPTWHRSCHLGGRVAARRRANCRLNPSTTRTPGPHAGPWRTL